MKVRTQNFEENSVKSIFSRRNDVVCSKPLQTKFREINEFANRVGLLAGCKFELMKLRDIEDFDSAMVCK